MRSGLYFSPADVVPPFDSLFARNLKTSLHSDFDPNFVFLTRFTFSVVSDCLVVSASSLDSTGSVLWLGTEALSGVRWLEKQSSCHFSQLAFIPSTIGCSFLLSFSSAWEQQQGTNRDRSETYKGLLRECWVSIHTVFWFLYVFDRPTISA